MEEMVEKGEIYTAADENVADLRNYHFKKHWKAKNGEPGRGSDQNGRGGDPCILKVPMGTEVREMDSGELIVNCSITSSKFSYLKAERVDAVMRHLKARSIRHRVNLQKEKLAWKGSTNLRSRL